MPNKALYLTAYSFRFRQQVSASVETVEKVPQQTSVLYDAIGALARLIWASMVKWHAISS